MIHIATTAFQRFVYAGLLAIACSACWPMQSADAKPLALQTGVDFYQLLLPYTEFYIDSDGSASLQDVIDSGSRFKPIDRKYINFGATQEGRLWLRTSVQNTGVKTAVWRVDVNRQYYQELNIYVVRTNSINQQVLRHTRNDNFTDRPLKDRMLGADLTLQPNESIELYLGVRSNTATFIPLAIGSIEATVKQHAREDSLNFLFNGALLVVIVITLTMISIVGWRIATSFSLYILAGLVYVLHTDGYLFVHLWPNHMAWNDPLNLSFMLSMPIFGLIFARQLFDFKSRSTVIDGILKAYILLAALAVIFSFQLFEIRPLKIIAYLLTPIGSIIQLLVAGYALQHKMLGAKPYFIGALIIMASLLYATLGHALPGRFDLDATLDFGHFALLTESIAFAAAITIRLSGLRDERDTALQTQLNLVRERLQLSEQLKQVEKDFSKAQSLADMRRAQLSTVSHDIQQPLASLRLAMGNVKGFDEQAVERMHNALDYLENLASQQIETARNDTVDLPHDSQLESFAVSAVLDNVCEMFRSEAESKGIRFRYRPCHLKVVSEPIALMRAVCNLVSNAINHNRDAQILLAARRRDNRVRIEVWDSGDGMDQHLIDRHHVPYTKGAESQGTGLGLSIVNDFARQFNLEFSLKSVKGKGTSAMIYLPTGFSKDS